MAEHPKDELSVPHTRADAAECDERVARILQLVANGEFVPGKTNRELRNEWGLDGSTVSRYVAEAFRFIRLHRLGLEDDINRRLAFIEEDRRLARAKVRNYCHKGEIISTVPEPDVGAMIAADRLYLETIGALVRTREVKGEEPNIELTLRAEIVANPAVARGLLSLIASVLPKNEILQLTAEAPIDNVDGLDMEAKRHD